jgi:hypothetical protein
MEVALRQPVARRMLVGLECPEIEHQSYKSLESQQKGLFVVAPVRATHSLHEVVTLISTRRGSCGMVPGSMQGVKVVSEEARSPAERDRDAINIDFRMVIDLTCPWSEKSDLRFGCGYGQLFGSGPVEDRINTSLEFLFQHSEVRVRF